ncbi:hypothetical protein BGZ73_003569 [Actinomortierella ambigua]|nr:hypothetical protein BGZ73_003569 [Actinomortierella ambigua]
MVRHRSDSNHRYRSSQAVPDSPKTPRTPPSTTRVLRSPSSRHRNLYTPVHSLQQQQQQRGQQQQQQHPHQQQQHQQQPLLRRYYSRPDDETDSDRGNPLVGNTANKNIGLETVPGWSDTIVGGDLYQSPNASLRALGNNSTNNSHSSMTRSRSPSPSRSSSSSPFTSRPATRSRIRHQQLDALSSAPSTPRSSSSSASSSPFSQADSRQQMDISPIEQPTPSELLSMDLNVLKLASVTSTPSAVRIAADPFTFSGVPKSPSKGSGQAGTSSRAMLTSVHRYPTRTPPKPYTVATASPRRPQTPNTPRKGVNKSSSGHTGSPFLVSSSSSSSHSPSSSSPFLVNKSSSSSSSTAAATSPGQSLGKFMADEDHNLFLTSSPKAVRTPRKSAPSPGHFQPSSPVPAPRFFSPKRMAHSSTSSAVDIDNADVSTTTTPGEPVQFTIYQDSDTDLDDELEDVRPRNLKFGRRDETIGASDNEDNAEEEAEEDVDEDDRVETESLPSSVGGETEKENMTPKLSDDGPAFFIGGPYSKRSYAGGHATPGGWTTGHASSSSSAATAATAAAATASGSGGSASCSTPTIGDGSTKPGVITRSKRNALGTISPWRWNSVLADQILAMYMKGCKSGSSSGTTGSCGQSSSSSSSSNGGPSASGDTNTFANAASSSSSSSAAGASSSSSSTSCAGASSSSSSSSKKVKIPELPSITPNPQLAKMAEEAVKPGAAAFTRRAQQVAGRIYYWKHGGYHLISDQDKQTWPGEWKFDIFQDPDSPASTVDGGEGMGSRSRSVSPPPGGGGAAVAVHHAQYMNRAANSPTLHVSQGSSYGATLGSSSSASTSSPSLAFGQGYPLMPSNSHHHNTNSSGHPSNGKGKGRLVERPPSMGLGLSGPTAKRMRITRDRPLSSGSENSLGMEFSVESTPGSGSGSSSGSGSNSSGSASMDVTSLILQQQREALNDENNASSSVMDVAHEYLDGSASPGMPMSITSSSSSSTGGGGSGGGGSGAAIGSSPGGSGGIVTRAGLKRARQSDSISLKFQDRYDFRERRMMNTSMVGGGGRSRRR